MIVTATTVTTTTTEAATTTSTMTSTTAVAKSIIDSTFHYKLSIFVKLFKMTYFFVNCFKKRSSFMLDSGVFSIVVVVEGYTVPMKSSMNNLNKITAEKVTKN